MKKENVDLVWSWFFVLWWSFALINTIRVGIFWGLNSIDFQFTIAIVFFFGIPISIFLIKSVRKKEFRLRPVKED